MTNGTTDSWNEVTKQPTETNIWQTSMQIKYGLELKSTAKNIYHERPVRKMADYEICTLI